MNSENLAIVKNPTLNVNFYEYEFDNELKKFKVSAIKNVELSFIQTSNWYKLYILVNGQFTGRYLNLVSANSVEYYSLRKEIGLAYRNYKMNKFVPLPKNKILGKDIFVPESEKTMVNRVIFKHLIHINKFNSRDELTELGLI